jgi:phospholipid/cholesterol/gamma-HCH transport system permease protein
MAFAGEYIFRPRSWRRLLRFAGFATAAALSPSAYGPVARAVAVRQIYLTAWKILPGYLVSAALLSLLLIEVVAASARKYGVAQYSLELVLSVLVLELVPLVTALFVALRSGAAIGAEIALMSVRGELDDAEEAGASPLHAELVPRIAGAALSVASLTSLGCLIAVWLAYVVFYGFTPAGLPEFSRVVGNVFDGLELANFGLKCLLFGLAVAIVPAATALEAERGVIKSLPAVVLGGLVKLFFVILAVEVASLVVKYV